MQTAEVVLGVLRERGRKGLPFTQLYRQMFNKDLYLLAYGNIYSNQGAMTPGGSEETADGMSEDKIDQIIEAMRHERYRFSPARRVYIPKKNGKLRPLGLPSWSDKLVGEVVRLLLEAIYEPRFSDRSHGFRKRRGCHTALREIRETWTGTTWFIEGDISDCFGSFDHEILLGILAEKIHDQRFLRLIRHMLKAGYLEDWDHHDTLSGVPQGGVVSPILSNIYLDKLDEFVERELIPRYTRGALRAANPAYRQVDALLRRARRRGDRAETRRLAGQMRTLPSTDPMDPGYRRLRYVRYADDHLLGFTGPKAEAEQIKAHLTTFLRDTLKLELSQEKTLITHARTGTARFLGYNVTVQHANHRRSINGAVGLRVPPDVIKAKCAPYRKLGKPEVRSRLVNEDDHAIVETYGAEYRGLVNYYLLAGDVSRLNRVHWVMETSLLKTLACKYHSTVSKMAARYKATIDTPHGPRTCLRATVARTGRKPLTAIFGGIPLKRQRKAVLTDRKPPPDIVIRRTELIQRLQAGRCEMCQRTGEVQVHHVGKLAHLGKPGKPQPPWAQLMTRKRRNVRRR
jgi:group II intron reverse transcriptase/maturase